jgi:hypothetical protein
VGVRGPLGRFSPSPAPKLVERVRSLAERLHWAEWYSRPALRSGTSPPRMSELLFPPSHLPLQRIYRMPGLAGLPERMPTALVS